MPSGRLAGRRICTWKAGSKQEMELGYKASRPTYCDPLPSVKLHPLRVLLPSQTVPPAGDQVLKQSVEEDISHSNPGQMLYAKVSVDTKEQGYFLSISLKNLTIKLPLQAPVLSPAFLKI